MQRLIPTIFLILLSSLAVATPQELVIDQNVEDKVSDGKIMAAHEPIKNTKEAKEARLAILKAMHGTRRGRWYMEYETDNAIRGRFDYRGSAIFVDIEFNDELIQIKYADGFDDYICEIEVEGICYDAYRHYYSFLKRLRLAIQKNL